LYMVKILLGFSMEGGLLAKDFATSNNSKCKSAGEDFLAMNLNPKLTDIIYGSFAESVTALGNVRKGFYCILCDGVTQQQLAQFWSIVNLFYSNRIYFSSDFCVGLVDKTIRSSYFTVTYVQRFLNNLGTLMNCKTGSQQQLTFEVSFIRKQVVKNCFFFKSKYFFFFCESYCQDFHLVKPSDLLENDLTELEKFFNFIRENRDATFYNPYNNLLWAGQYEERYVVDMLPKVKETKVFFPASANPSVDLSTYRTDVVYSGGMNPWESVESSTFPMTISGAGRISLSALMAVLYLNLAG